MSKRHPAWNKWYDSARWIKRARHQLQIEPFCRMCAKDGLAVAANVADHIEPHGGDPLKFWVGDLQSLCFHHHNSEKRLVEGRGYSNKIGLDGRPIDPQHPSY